MVYMVYNIQFMEYNINVNFVPGVDKTSPTLITDAKNEGITTSINKNKRNV